MLEQTRPELNMKEILQWTSREWHSLTEDEKQIYRDEAERDKIASDQSMGIYTPFKPKRPQQPMIPGYPIVKKPLSPYMCFLKEQRALLVQ